MHLLRLAARDDRANDDPASSWSIRMSIKDFPRITFDPEVMGGKPCIRGLRVTVGTIVGLVAAGYSTADILRSYPYLEAEDVREALEYAAWRVEEHDLPLVRA
jgi:uncharacterized protein (DUF433 family)